MTEQLQTQKGSASGTVTDLRPSPTSGVMPIWNQSSFKKIGGAAAIAAMASSANAATVPDQPADGVGLEYLGHSLKVSILSGLEAQMIAMDRKTQVSVSALQAKLDALSATVALLAARQYSVGETLADVESSRFIPGQSDVGALLDFACDEGIIDNSIVALAEDNLTSDDRMTKLAAIRTIALADPSRGKSMIEAALAKESNATVRSLLGSTLRAIT